MILHGNITASVLGMHPTDLFALGVVELHGPLGAGELSERTGLSTGATTRLIDRLQRAGQLRRVPDPADRRRVIVEKVRGHELDEALNAAFEPIERGMEEVLSRFPAERLADVMDFLEQTTSAIQSATGSVQKIAKTRRSTLDASGP
ncbi:MarR family winged helix-turn-helix transcriptional regulator [Nonomuraea diastatica]|uniref:MarR family winged helix-turn-helix transcriptional regulator n=1 Tax=Nonomuraea diastatica TaxID=1848329 RepID=UPI001FE8922A|nr:MarR family transcriptional regulator [Nonomuraea diastatica]